MQHGRHVRLGGGTGTSYRTSQRDSYSPRSAGETDRREPPRAPQSRVVTTRPCSALSTLLLGSYNRDVAKRQVSERTANRCGAEDSGTLAEVGGADRRVGEQFLSRPLEHDLPVGEHVAAGREPERLRGVLLH